ncbi:hypothetical protein AJ87_01250, partial [Rhizobium yanglingense]
EHWDFMCVLNTAHAGELFLKAAIATEHPLLIFKDVFGFDDGQSSEIELENLIKKGKTHDFEKLPQILWAVSASPSKQRVLRTVTKGAQCHSAFLPARR